jgi:PAS domain S-box-containing protein
VASARPRGSIEADSISAVALRVGVVALAYFVGARLGLRLAFSNENVTAVWPPTGIAVAALVLLGPRMWLGVAAGALLANLTNGASLPTSIGIAIGNTLAPVVAASLLRTLNLRASLERVRDVIVLVFAGGLASMVLSATGGTTTLLATGALEHGTYGSTWLTWWIGDSLGVVIFAPLIVTFLGSGSDLSLFRDRSREAAILYASAIVASILVFTTTVPLPYALVPFAIWAAMRFYQPGAAALSVVVSIVAILETVSGNGPFSMSTRTTNLMVLQAFNASVVLIALSLAALTRERARAQADLRAAADELEDRVRTRTAELTTSEERMREAQGLAHIGSWHWDVASNTVSWTDELYRIYGLEPQATGATFEGYVERVHPENREQVITAVRSTLNTGRPFEHDYRIVRPDGTERWVHARGEPVIDSATGATIALGGFCHDVTHLKEAEETLRGALESERETARRLRLLDEFKDSLLTAVSHELRTPLTVIIGLASTLRSEEVALSDADQHELVKRLEANARRLDSLLMDLLDIDRLNRRVVEPHPRPTELRATVARVLELLAIDGRTVEVDLNDAVASVDTAHLERIVENLVANATKHTPAESPIWIRSEQRDDGVVLVVEDAGPGVPAELQTEIFEPFRRGDAKSHSPGTGIGLTLVARFAALNGGRAWVEERRGGGASFHVLLPRGTGTAA